MVDKSFVFQRIGMALVSAQRVEYLTRELVIFLLKFDKQFYGLTTTAFLDNSPSAEKLRKQTLGKVFKLLKLNPKWIPETELNKYLEDWNILVHNFWRKYLNTLSEEQARIAIEFCNEFGKQSTFLERYFKGFIYLLALRNFEITKIPMPDSTKILEKDLDFFINWRTAKYSTTK